MGGGRSGRGVGGQVSGVGGGQGGLERRIEAFVKIKKKMRGGGGVGGRVCQGGGVGGSGVRLDGNGELKLL